MRSAPIRVCVLLPAFNESKNIARVVAEVRDVRVEGHQIVTLVVDDGSKDNTAALAAQAGATVLSHPRNRGVGAAFRTGRNWALEQGFDILIHMDSDGQVQAHEIPLLLQPVSDGVADLALGSRFLRRSPEHLAAWKAMMLHGLARGIGVLTGYSLSDLSCGFRCMNRRILEVVNPTTDYDYIQETLIQALAAKARIVEVAVDILYEREPARPGMSGRTLRYGTRFLALTGSALVQFYATRLRGQVE